VRVQAMLAVGLLWLGPVCLGMPPVMADPAHRHDTAAEREPFRPTGFEYDPPAPGSYRLPPLATAADGTALDETGAVRSLRGLMTDRITVLSFIYTRCGDICPLGTMLMPDHDTPEVMASEARALRVDGGADWQFLTASGMSELAAILAAYDQRVIAKANPDDPRGPLAHQLRVYLIDRELRIRNIYSLDFLDPRLVLADIRTLILEETANN
jgi:protein SCO1/2